MTIITLLTDFGCEDEYVAMMKGAILSINSAARLIDISHGIAPQNIARAGLAIENTYRYFPAGTIHAVVVDPEVGSDRAIIAMESRGHRFVGPDNGLFSRLLAAGDPDMLVAVSESAYFLKPVSRTFHGRDIIAPVAAHLSLGVEMNRLGRALRPDQLVFLPDPAPVVDAAGRLVGRIVASDRFGNLMTNIREDLLDRWRVEQRLVGKRIIVRLKGNDIGLFDRYSAVGSQQALALVGSSGCLEIAVNQGNARIFFQAAVDDTIRVESGCDRRQRRP